MTPAVIAATKAGITFELHEYTATASGDGHQWGIEAAELLGIERNRVFKTIVLQIDNRALAVGVVPVASEVNLKAFAHTAQGKKAMLAPTDKAQRSTGYVLGGISPLGQRQSLPTFIDSSALEYKTIFVSGGRRGLEIELAVADLLDLTKGKTAPIAR